MHRSPSSQLVDDGEVLTHRVALLSEHAITSRVLPPPPRSAPGHMEWDFAADRQALTAPRVFDELYICAAPGLIQQAYMLTGCRQLAFESAEQAFQQAWERWPEVERDPDPVGWVRAQAHDYALSPWHRLRRLTRPPGPEPTDPVHRALLALPPWRRRAVLLCDGLGLSVAETATETEASTAVTDRRLWHARTAINRQLSVGSGDALRSRVQATAIATIAQPWSVRATSELRVRAQTRAAFAATAALMGLVTITIATTPDRNEPINNNAHHHTVRTNR